MDETGLYWKRTPDRTLSTRARPSTKKSKDRISIALTTNADGTEKLPLLIISNATKLRAFKKINVKVLRVQYHVNKKA